MNPQQSNQYVPGVCNIGEAEIRQRIRVGWIGLVVTVVVWALFDYLGVSWGWKLILFFPASFGATGFLQGWMHFCAGFGMKGVFNFSEKAGTTDTVSQAEFRAKDRAKAISIFIYSVLIGVIVIAIACLL